MAFSMEWSVFNKEESSKAERPPVQFPEFSPFSASYKFEPMNLNYPNKKIKERNDLPCCSSLISLFVTNSPIHKNLNEKSVENICVHFPLASFLCLFSFSFLDFK